jgi:hypothetical protein
VTSVTASNTFDQRTHKGEFSFVNNSTKTITAYAVCSFDKARPGWRSCNTTDDLYTLLDEAIARKMRPVLRPRAVAIRPEQRSKVFFSDNSLRPELLEFRVVTVIFDDGTFEGDSNVASGILADRKESLEGERFVISTLKNILDSSPGNEVVAAKEALEKSLDLNPNDLSRVRVWLALEYGLKKPDFGRHGSVREFVPADQSAYLKQVIANHEDFVRQFMLHLPECTGAQPPHDSL